MKQAVFLDRDGTLIEEVGYLDCPEDIRVYPAAFDAVSKINESGALAIVITNQSAVARGWVNEQDLQQWHQLIARTFQANGSRLDGFYYCPHHPDMGSEPYKRVCTCRKPKPGLLQRAANELNINLLSSYMVGDRLIDIETGHRASCGSILVKSGCGLLELDQLNNREKTDADSVNHLQRPDQVVTDVLDGVKWILEQTSEQSFANH